MLVKIGQGTVVLAGANSFAAAELDEGVVQADSNSAFDYNGVLSRYSSLSINGGTLNMNGHSFTVDTLAGGFGTITNSNTTASTLTVSSGANSFGGAVVNGNGEVAVSGPVTLAGNQTTVSVESSANPVENGQAVFLTAFVAAVGTTTDHLSGNVEFFDSSTQIGTAVPINSGDTLAQATISVTLSAGVHTITAYYAGSNYFDPSTSSTFTLYVGPAVTITGLPTSPVPEGQSLPSPLGCTLSGVPTGATITYSWSVVAPDGTPFATGNTSTFNFTPNTYGNWTVTLVTSADGVPGPSDTASIAVSNLPPVFTDATPFACDANNGQTFTLPSTTFTDPGLGDWHTATIVWGDSSDPADAQVTEPYMDGVTLVPGTITASHVYWTATDTTNYGVITLSDGDQSVTRNFTVHVHIGQVVLTNFAPSSDGTHLLVSYTVSNAASAPFTIGVYASGDGTSADNLLMSYSVTASGDLTETSGTPHTVSFTPAFDDLPSDYHLIAQSDSNSSLATSVEFAGGIFIAQSVTLNPPQTIAYVFGTSGDDTIEVSPSSISFNGGPAFTLPNGITEIHVRGEDGNDSLTEDSGVTVPVSFYGGNGHDTVTGDKLGDTIDLGDVGPPELRADGPPTIMEGQSATLVLSAAMGNATIVDWNINWGDWNYETVYTTTPSHTYTTGAGTYTVYVSADDSDGGTETCPNTVQIGVLPLAPTGITAAPVSGTDDQVHLSWTDLSQLATSYRVEESTNGTDFTLVGTLGGYATSDTVSGLTAATHYYFRVCAVDYAGRSNYVQADCTTGSNSSGTLAEGDDNYSAAVDLQMSLNFYGVAFSQVCVSNNGYLTIGAGNGAYRPNPLTTAYGAIFAPFFADVDTRDGHGIVTYGPTTVGGRAAWTASWDGVDYFNETNQNHDSKSDTFSVTLIDRADVATGDFDIQFAYSGLQWDTGDASGGQDGLVNSSPAYPARAGYSNGTGESGTYYELSGSGTAGGLLTLSGTHTYQIRNTANQVSTPVVGLTAYRTGGNYGAAVAEADRASSDPSNYVILVNDDYEQDPAGQETDLAYNQGLANCGQRIDVGDHDVAQVTLHQLQLPAGTSGGTVHLVLSNYYSANVYDNSGHLLSWADLSATLGGTGYLAGLASHDVGIYIEGVQADPDFSLAYTYNNAYGSEQARVDVHMAIADISVVDVNGNNLSFLPVNEDLPTMLDPSAVDAVYGLCGSLQSNEFKTNIAGLHSAQIEQVMVTSDAGDQYQDSMTDTVQGAQSNLFAVVVDNNGLALTTAQHGQIRSFFNLNAIDPPNGEQVEVKTKKDDQSRKVQDDPTAMPFAFPFNQTADEHLDEKGNPVPVITPSVACSNGKLTVTVHDAADWNNQTPSGPGGHDILKIFTGDSALGRGDTDSGQFAVVWTDANGNVVGQYTNAHAQGVRSSAADWNSNGYKGSAPKGKGQRAVTNDKAVVPSGAVNVTVVLLFTDILQGPRDDTATVNTNGRGDLPAIIGSWSGKLENGSWMFTKQQGDVDILTQIRNGWPTPKQVWGAWTWTDWGGWQDAVKNRVEEVTKRKYTLSIRGPKWKNNNLNPQGQPSGFDTGFDIVERQ